MYAWGNVESETVDGSVFISNYGPELVVGGPNQRFGSDFCGRSYNWATPYTWTNMHGVERTGTSYMYGIGFSLPTPKEVLFISGWFMFPVGFQDGINFQAGDLDQTKFLMVGPDDNSQKTYFQTREGYPPQLRTETEDGYGSEQHGDLVSWSPEGTWHRFDIYVDLTKAYGEKIHNFYVDGKKVQRINEFYFEILEGLKPFTRIGWTNYQFEGDDNNTWMQYLDDMYFDLTQARVEICNENIWNESRQKHCEIQIPTAWSDGSINFTANQGSFLDGETAYLFVVDENGNVSTGYPILLGDPTCSEKGGVDCCTAGETCDGTSYGTASDCSGICCSVVCTTSGTCSSADNNPVDGVVNITELMDYIGDWKAGTVTITELMTGIGEWKNGC